VRHALPKQAVDFLCSLTYLVLQQIAFFDVPPHNNNFHQASKSGAAHTLHKIFNNATPVTQARCGQP
jgi:hypothetical protein